MAKFEVGKSYHAADSGIDPITVLKRTAKSIKVTNGQSTWMMRIRNDENGEYVIDSSMPRKWRSITYLFHSIWNVK